MSRDWTRKERRRARPLSNGKVFGKDDKASGLGAETAREKARRWVKESEKFNDGSDSGNGGNAIEVIAAEEHKSLESCHGMKNDKKCPTTPCERTSEAHNKYAMSSNSKKRKATSSLSEPKLIEALSNIVVALQNMNEILKEENNILRMNIERSQPRVYTEEDVYAELLRVGVDLQTHMEGYTFLTENPARARAFFGCPVEDRLKFLFSQMQSARAL